MVEAIRPRCKRKNRIGPFLPASTLVRLAKSPNSLILAKSDWPIGFYLLRSRSMRVRFLGCLAAVAGLALALAATRADDVKSGPDKKIGGPFDVKAITGELKGRQLCYV